MGMVTAPYAFERRDQTRETMLQYDAVLKDRIAFRFIVGDNVHMQTHRSVTSKQRNVLSKAEDKRTQRLQKEAATSGDLLQLDALDGNEVEVACSCVEKTTSWVRYALAHWPSARFIGKTEDDTYVNLAVLEHELRALADRPNLLYGYMTLAVLPSRPTLYPERSPKKACVTLINECRKDARAGKPKYTEGCFLGDLESKLDVPGRLGFVNGVIKPWKGTKVRSDNS